MLRILVSLSLMGLIGCSHVGGSGGKSAPAALEQGSSVSGILFADIPWKPSNPKAPQGVMVHLLSSNDETGAFNAIVKVPAGLKIPLHTHSAEFSAVTLSGGMVHAAQTGTDTPLAKGSMWVQPANEPHVDECQGEEDCVFMVFFKGAIDTTFVDAPAKNPKMVVTPAEKIVWKELRPEMEKGPRMAVLSGNPKTGAFSAMVEFPAGMTTNVHTHTAGFVGGIVSGTHHRGVGPERLVTLTNGSVWSEESGAPHMEKCGAHEPCVIAFQMDGALDEQQVKISMNHASE